MKWASDYIINKTWKLGRFKTHLTWRDDKSIMRRFGGGWRYSLGIQVGGSSILINLLILSISFSWYKDNKNNEEAKVSESK